MSQNQMILEYLEEYGKITPQEALQNFGIMRLGARIYDLRKLGYNIKSSKATTTNRFGQTVYYAVYTYVPEEAKA